MVSLNRHSVLEAKQMEPSKPRLDRSDFLHRGLEVLVADGPGALTAARLARELKVSTGSFFWHFKTVDRFRDELKTFWRDEVIVGTIRDAKERADDPGKVMEEIGKIVRRRGTHRYDAAMRLWAETDCKAEEIVRSADQLRGDLIAGVLKDAGASTEGARDRASLFGAAWRGSQEMKTDHRFKLMSMITDESGTSS